MTEQVTIQLRFPAWPGTFASSRANYAAYQIRELVPVGTDLPDPLYITRVSLWNQNSMPYPAESRGHVALAIDPRGQYAAESGFPQQQATLPYFLKSLAIYEPMPSGPKGYVQAFNPPVAYRASQGDLLIWVPEVDGTGPMHVTATVYFLANGDIPEPPPEPAPPDATTVYQITLVAQAGPTGTALCHRARVLGIAAGGSEARVRFTALQQPTIIEAASVGIRSGATSSTTAPPVPLTFAGQPGVTVSPGQSVWSDWVGLATVAGQDLLVTTWQANLPENWWGFTENAAGGWYSLVDSTGSAAMLGTPVNQETRAHVLDRVQVR